jgi:hypothetical protein
MNSDTRVKVVQTGLTQNIVHRTHQTIITVILSVVFPCMLIITQLLFQIYALAFIKSARYYNLYFLSLYS